MISTDQTGVFSSATVICEIDRQGGCIMRFRFRLRVVLVVAFATGSLAACSTIGPSAADATSTAAAFRQAVDAGDGGAACELLNEPAREDVESSTGADCETGILALELGDQVVRSTDVYGRSALVESSTGSVFLTVVDSAWRIRAAGCAPVKDAPFECAIEGS
jgi:hypothetical protein